MRITKAYTYDAARSRVLGILTDAQLYEQAAVRSKAISHTVTVANESGRTRIRLERELPTDEVPSFAKSLVGSALIVVEQTWWDAHTDDVHDVSQESGQVTEGGFDVSIPRTPVTFVGQMRLEDLGPQTRQIIEGELKAAIPFLGRKIEEAMSVPIVHQLDLLAEMVGTRLATD